MLAVGWAMRHHFGDMLDRSLGHWTIAPNRDRWCFHFEDVADAPPTTEVITLTREDKNWDQVERLENLVELTLHNPSAPQFDLLTQLKSIKRLRISHARPKSVEFLRSNESLEELVLEYVSGFSSLSPIGELPVLRSLHLENLRRVSDFSGLKDALELQYLSIQGTLDWTQPVESFDFLCELKRLEFFSLWRIRNSSKAPALSCLARLPHLKKLAIASGEFPLEDYAFLQAALPSVDGASREPAKVVSTDQGETTYFLDKGSRVLTGTSALIRKRRAEKAARYRELVSSFGKTKED